MKNSLTFVLFICMAIASFSQNRSTIEGRWVRVKGDLDGMTMDIHQEGNEVVGVLTNNSKHNFFEEGELKWKGFNTNNNGELVVRSLYKELGVDNETIESDYLDKKVLFLSPSEIVVISKKYYSSNSSGHIQYWVRKNSI